MNSDRIQIKGRVADHEHYTYKHSFGQCREVGSTADDCFKCGTSQGCQPRKVTDHE